MAFIDNSMQLYEQRQSALRNKQARTDANFMGAFQAMDQMAQRNKAEQIRQEEIARQDEIRKRQEAFQNLQTAMELRQGGYAASPDQVGQILTSGQGMSGLFEQRTPEYEAKLAHAKQDRELERAYKQAQIGKLYADASKERKANNPTIQIAQKQAEEISKKNANVFTVKNGLDAVLGQLDNPDISEDEKIKAGQAALKLLNSAEGQDAVGAEESRRLGSLLEYKIANLTEPGSFVGRDLGMFTEQLRNKSSELGDRIRSNEDGSRRLLNGESLGQIASKTPGRASGVARQNPFVNSVKHYSNEGLLSREQELLQKAGRMNASTSRGGNAAN